jgi:hypothetical protein
VLGLTNWQSNDFYKTKLRFHPAPKNRFEFRE